MKKYYWFNYIYNNTGSTISSARGAWYSRKIFHLVFLIESISLVYYVDYLLCLLQWPQYSPRGSMAWEVIYSLSKVHSKVFTQQWLPGMAGWAELRVEDSWWRLFFQQRQGWPHQEWGKGGKSDTFSHYKALNFQCPFLCFVIIV